MIARNRHSKTATDWIKEHFTALEPVVNYHAGQLARTRREFRQDQPSIANELWQELVQKAGKYDPSKASPRTFAKVICRRKIISIIRAQEAGTRGYGKTQEFSAFDSDCRIETNLDENTKARHRGIAAEDRRDLEMDVCEICQRLDPRHRKLAEKLQTLTPKEAAKKLRLSDAELTRQMEAIRKCFERADLDKYHSV